MRLAIPLSVLERYAHGIREGRWEGWGLVLDGVGFSAFTEKLERTLGPHGLERLVGHLQDAYARIFPRIRNRGGEVVQFTGDGLIAWFPLSEPEEVRALLRELSRIPSAIPFRGMLVRGPLRWKIVEHHRHALYVLFGEAFLQEHWEKPSRLNNLPPSSPEPRSPSLETPSIFHAENHELLGRFLPLSILAGSDEGMFRDVVVVFVLLQRSPLQDPEKDARTVLRHAVETGGWVARMGFSEKGLEALTLFGAPRAREGLLEHARAFTQRLKQSFDEDVRGGLATGWVFAGWVGGERGEYTVMGRAVNRAAHLAMAARWGEFLEEDLLPGSAPVVALEQGPPRLPFIGRDEAFDRLHRILETAAGGHPRLALVTGPPGMGKTRFLEEARHRIWPERTFLLQADPGLPPLEVLYQWLDAWVGSRPDREDFPEAVLQFTENISRKDLRWSIRLRELLQPGFREGMGEARWLVALLEALLRTTGEEGPVVVAVDDLPWLDRASRDVFRMLLHREGLPLVIWASAPRRMETGLASVTIHVPLRPFRDPEIRRFAALYLKGVPDARLLAFLRDRSGGNPLVLEQLLFFLQVRGALERVRGFWTLKEDVREIPFRVREVILARFDRLDPLVREILLLAAVAGNRWKTEWLQRALAVDIHAVLGVAGGFVRLASSWGTFTHAMFRDVLYRMQTSRSRARRHLSLARAMEESGDIVPAALHRFRAWRLGEGDASDVHGRLRQALEQIRPGGDPHLRMELLETLEMLEVLPEERVDIYLEKAKLFVRIGKWDQAAESFRSAEVLARKLGDLSRVALVLKEKAFLLMLRSAFEEAVRVLEDAREAALLAGDPESLAGVENIMGTVFWNWGKPREALEAFHRSRKHAARAGRGDLVIRGLNNIANVLDELGQHQEAEVYYREYIRHTAESENHFREASGWLNLGGNLLFQERYDEAIATLTHARTRFRALHHPRGLASADHNLSMAFLEKGYLQKALKHAWQARRIYTLLGYPKGLAMIHGVMAEIFRRAGEPRRARMHIRQALRYSRRGKLLYARGEALMVRAELLRQEGRWLDLLNVAEEVQHVGDTLRFPRLQFAGRALACEARWHLSGGGRKEELHELERFCRSPGDRSWILSLRWQMERDPRIREKACAILRELYARTGRILYRERLARLGCL